MWQDEFEVKRTPWDEAREEIAFASIVANAIENGGAPVTTFREDDDVFE